MSEVRRDPVRNRLNLSATHTGCIIFLHSMPCSLTTLTVQVASNREAINLHDLHERVAVSVRDRPKTKVPEKEDAASQKLKSPWPLHRSRHETALEQRRFDHVRENIN